jgi:hypothetical protein
MTKTSEEAAERIEATIVLWARANPRAAAAIVAGEAYVMSASVPEYGDGEYLYSPPAPPKAPPSPADLVHDAGFDQLRKSGLWRVTLLVGEYEKPEGIWAFSKAKADKTRRVKIEQAFFARSEAETPVLWSFSVRMNKGAWKVQHQGQADDVAGAYNEVCKHASWLPKARG